MRGLPVRIVWVILTFVAAGAVSATGQGLTNRSSVLDATGGWSGGGPLSNLCAVGQPGGVRVGAAGDLVHFAGFLNTFALRPDLDHDGDGVADEFDLDNDGDGLTDEQEILGTLFFPTTPTDVNDPDSDHDGFGDAAESGAGTDPLNAGAYLHIVSVAKVTNRVVIGWLARSNVTYAVRSDDWLGGGGVFTGAVGLSTAHGAASAPWYATTNYYADTNAPATSPTFYRVEVAP
jgi:hypothetical protein